MRKSSTSPIYSGLVVREPKRLVGKTVWVKRYIVPESNICREFATKIEENIEKLHLPLKHRNVLRYRGCAFEQESNRLEIYTDAADHFGVTFERRINEKALMRYARGLLKGLRYLQQNGLRKITNIDLNNTVFDLEDNIKFAWFAENDKLDVLRNRPPRPTPDE